MDRRTFVQTTGAAVLASGLDTTVQAAPPRRRPNLLYVFSDQHRAASLPGEPYNQAAAPNIDAFRRANFSMERCVSTYPLCTPYRGILMSGRWPYQTGLTHNNVALSANEVSLGRVFKDAGYRTGYVGKWHLQGRSDAFIPAGPDRLGFEDWRVWERTNLHYKSWTYDPDTGQRVQPEGWNCTRMTDQAITLLQSQTPEKPWMLMLSWNPPHPPYNPPEEDADRYSPGSLRFRPNVAFPLEGRQVRGEAKPLTGADALHRAMQGYYGAITGVDTEFGRLLKALDDVGQAHDTIVVYTSDHGDMMGSQGRMAKQVPFEESCRVPFFVRYPGVTPGGGKSNTLFAAVDIYPTLCSLAGLPVPRHCVGRDMSAIMRGHTAAASKSVFLMNQMPTAGAPDPENTSAGEDGDAPLQEAGGGPHGARRVGREFINLPSYRGLRTDTHTYAVADSGRWCLYDNVADPFQMKNLVNDPAQQALMAGFDGEIVTWLRAAGDPFPFAEAVTHVSSFPT